MSIQSCTIHSNPSAIHRIVCGYLTLIFHVGCVWILSIVFGLYNCGIWHRGCSITYTPPYAKKLCQKELCRLLLDYADCNWIVQLYLDCTIVIGLYDCNWIVRLYLDCTIVFGLYYCTWIIKSRDLYYLYPPSFCAKKLSQK